MPGLVVVLPPFYLGDNVVYIFDVGLQAGLLRKALLALVALVVFDLVVDRFYVILEIGIVNEAFVAYGTHFGFDFVMDRFDVSCQPVPELKSHWTEVTTVM